MMNLLQVQDDLKNFSQDQLVKEMQQPSGTTPQFLVLSELNRRKRVKGDLEARQAQNQSTVAEEAVASAGVPQSGMMGMPEAMAPASADSEGIGSMMPKSMRTGGEVERYAEGGLLEGIAESVSRNQEMLGTVAQNKGKMNSNIMQPIPAIPSQLPTQVTTMPTRPMPFPHISFNGFGGSPFNTGQNRIGQPLGFGGKGPQRPGRNTYGRPDSTIAGLGAFADIFNKKSPAVEPQAMAEGGVIKAQAGLFPNSDRDVLRSYKDRMSDGDFFDYLTPVENEEDDTRFDRVAKGADRILDAGGNLIPYLGNRIVGAGESVYDFFTDPIGPDEKQTKVNEKDSLEEENAVIGDGNQNIVPSPKLNLTSGDENKTLSIEEELLKRQAGLDKSRNFDKYMALAQAGLGILASEKPTLAGAIGEGGMQGLDAFNAANKRYEEGITDILNARSKIQEARIAAGAKGKLTRSGAIQALNTFTTSISSKEKLISDIMKDSYNSPSDEQKNEIAALRESIKDLEFQKSQLFGEAKIRPRPSINVGKLPSTQKAS